MLFGCFDQTIFTLQNWATFGPRDERQLKRKEWNDYWGEKDETTSIDIIFNKNVRIVLNDYNETELFDSTRLKFNSSSV